MCAGSVFLWLVPVFLFGSAVVFVSVGGQTTSSCNELREKLIKSQEDIFRLNVALAALLAKNTDDIRSRLSVLEVEFVTKQKSAQNLKGGDIDLLTDFHSLLSTQIEAIKLVIQMKSEEDLVKRNTPEIIADIKSYQFNEAEMKLLPILGVKKGITELIVHEVYANNLGNFALVMQLAQRVQSVDLAENILTALWNELQSNGHRRRDPQKLILFCEVIEDRVINNNNNTQQDKIVSKEQKESAVQLRDMALGDLKAICVTKFKAALLSYKCDVDSEVIGKLSSDVNLYKPDILREAIHLVIDDVFPQLNRTTLLTNIYDSEFIVNVVDALVYTYEKMKKVDDPNDPVLFLLLEQFTKLRMNGNLPAEQRIQMSKTISDFSQPLRTLYLSPGKVCFKNVQYSEYMYVGEPLYDKDRRHALTWRPGGKDRTGVWIAERPKGVVSPANEFIFTNLQHVGEYLFVAVHNFNDDNRHVLTWVPGGPADNDNQGKMRLELQGNMIAMKSVHFGHYLCCATHMFDGDRRYVLSSNRGTAAMPSCQWTLENCANQN